MGIKDGALLLTFGGQHALPPPRPCRTQGVGKAQGTESLVGGQGL
jgi:hypothetical protein